MTIRYTHSSTTLDQLTAEFGVPVAMMHLGAFRKSAETCPHCEHKPKEWLSKELVVEVALIIDYDNGPLINPEESAVVICECPECGKKNIYHYPLRMLAEQDFIDKAKIEAEMKKRGLVNGWKPKKEDESISQARVFQRLARDKSLIMAGYGMGSHDKPIPDFKIPCFGHVLKSGKERDCKTIWTKENSHPHWESYGGKDFLVARCPDCHAQRGIQDDIGEGDAK